MHRRVCSTVVVSSLSLISASMLWCVAALTWVPQVQAHQNDGPHALTNADVVKMVQAHLNTEILVAQIRDNPGDYSLTTDKLIQLKELGVPDAVISAMQAKGNSSRIARQVGGSGGSNGPASGREYTVAEFGRALPEILSKAAVAHGLGPHSYDKEEKLIRQILETCALDTSNLSAQAPDPKSSTFAICQRHPYQHTYIGKFEDMSLAAGDFHNHDRIGAVGRGDLLMDVGLPRDQPWWPGEKYTVALKVFMDWGPGMEMRFADVLSGVRIEGHVPVTGSWAAVPEASSPNTPPADFSDGNSTDCDKKLGMLRIFPNYLLNGSHPAFPDSAKHAFHEAILSAPFNGHVSLDAVIGRTGHVCSLKVVEHAFPYPPANQWVATVETALDNAAVEAVSKWVFRPALLNGRKVLGTTWIRVEFPADDATLTGHQTEGSNPQGAAAFTSSTPITDTTDSKSGSGGGIPDSGNPSNFGLLTATDLQKLETSEHGAPNNNLIMVLNLLRIEPSILNQKPFLSFFISLNNCGYQDRLVKVATMLRSEFDAPQVISFYKARAAQILSYTPSTLVVWNSGLTLGTYDMSRQAFPILIGGTNRVGFSISNVDMGTGIGDMACVGDAGILGGFPNVGDNTGVLPGSVGTVPHFYLSFQPFSVTELHMSPADAKLYVDSLGNGGTRTVQLKFTIDLLPRAPTLLRRHNYFAWTGEMEFYGQLKRVAVFGSRDQEIAELPVPASEAAPIPLPGLVPISTGDPGNTSTARPAYTSPSLSPGSVQGVASTSPAVLQTAPVPHSGIMGRNFAKNLANCDGGKSGDCNLVGFALVHGWGVDRNLSMAKYFYEKSCAMGSREGCFDAKNVPVN